MTVDVRASVVIARPVAEVAAFASEPINAPRWYRRIASAERLDDAPLAVGSRRTFHARFLRRSLQYTYEITELDPGARLTMRTAPGPFPMQTTYTWEPAGDGSTLMTLRNTGRPSGFPALVAPVLSLAMRRAMNQDLRALRQLLELA